MSAVLYIAGIMVIAKSHFEKESRKAKKIKKRLINWKIWKLAILNKIAKKLTNNVPFFNSGHKWQMSVHISKITVTVMFVCCSLLKKNVDR